MTSQNTTIYQYTYFKAMFKLYTDISSITSLFHDIFTELKLEVKVLKNTPWGERYLFERSGDGSIFQKRVMNIIGLGEKLA